MIKHEKEKERLEISIIKCHVKSKMSLKWQLLLKTCELYVWRIKFIRLAAGWKAIAETFLYVSVSNIVRISYKVRDIDGIVIS